VLACSIILTLEGCAVNHFSPSVDSAILGNRTEPVWPPPPQSPRISYLRSISGFSDSDTKTSWLSKIIDTITGKEESTRGILRPYNIFADAGRIYITDPGFQILHVYDMQNQKYLQIKNAGSQRFVSPIGISVDNRGEIYLSDSVLRKVFVFDKEGNFLREIGSPDTLLRPSGIAIHEEKVYVVDTHGHKVSVFSKKDGTMLFSFGHNGTARGEFHFPTNIFIGKDGLLYITDSMNFRVQIFDRDGNVRSAFGRLGDGAGDFSKPKGIAVDSEGHIYVTDAHFDNVQVFDRDGRLLLVFGASGSGNGEMILPAGLFIDKEDKIYVADSYNKRIQVFRYLKGNEKSKIQ